METSEYLITDWSGIGIEYAFAYERPVIYIDTPRKIMNKEFNDISIEPLEYKIRKEIGIIVKIEEVENITNFIDSLEFNKEKNEKKYSNDERKIYLQF